MPLFRHLLQSIHDCCRSTILGIEPCLCVRLRAALVKLKALREHLPLLGVARRRCCGDCSKAIKFGLASSGVGCWSLELACLGSHAPLVLLQWSLYQALFRYISQLVLFGTIKSWELGRATPLAWVDSFGELSSELIVRALLQLTRALQVVVKRIICIRHLTLLLLPHLFAARAQVATYCCFFM